MAAAAFCLRQAAPVDGKQKGFPDWPWNSPRPGFGTAAPSMAVADLATVFAAVAIALMERGRKGKGDFAVVYHRSSGRITTLESQMADRADRLTDWLCYCRCFLGSLEGDIGLNERK